MLVVEVIKLNRILNLLMILDATYWDVQLIISYWFMDRQKYLKSRLSIRIQQPETLESIKCHTFPGMEGRTLDILLHNSTLQLFLVPKVLFEMPAHPNSFIVLCNGVESDFMACACTNPPVWLGTTELAYFQVNLTPGWRSLAQTGGLAGCWPACWPSKTR